MYYKSLKMDYSHYNFFLTSDDTISKMKANTSLKIIFVFIKKYGNGIHYYCIFKTKNLIKKRITIFLAYQMIQLLEGVY